MQLTRLIEGDERLASYHLTYNNVQISNVDPYKPMGPNLLNELAWPVEVIKLDNKRYQIGITPIAPTDQL